jgi:hypothetical protein
MMWWKSTNSQPWQNSSQNSVLRRGAECHNKGADFLLHKYKKFVTISFELNLIGWICHNNERALLVSLPISILPVHSNSEIPTSSLYSKNKVCTLADSARPSPSLSLSVLLISGLTHGLTKCSREQITPHYSPPHAVEVSLFTLDIFGEG